MKAFKEFIRRHSDNIKKAFYTIISLIIATVLATVTNSLIIFILVLMIAGLHSYNKNEGENVIWYCIGSVVIAVLLAAVIPKTEYVINRFSTFILVMILSSLIKDAAKSNNFLKEIKQKYKSKNPKFIRALHYTLNSYLKECETREEAENRTFDELEMHLQPQEKREYKKEEVFVPIKGYEGLYKIGNFGSVKSLGKDWIEGDCIFTRDSIFLKAILDDNGCSTVNLFKNGKITTVRIQHLILDAFGDKKRKSPIVVKEKPLSDYRKIIEEAMEEFKTIKIRKIKTTLSKKLKAGGKK